MIRKSNQKIKKDNFFLLLFLFIILMSCSQKKKTDDIFSELDNSKYNILNIRYTGYSYNNNPIYSFNETFIGNEYFSKCNYLLKEGSKIYYIFAFKEMTVEQINKSKYLFDDGIHKSSESADVKRILLDFNLKVCDTLKTKPGRLILLKKEFDKNINDTVYLFSRKNVGQEFALTNIIASKKFGILGFYDLPFVTRKKKIIDNYYGWTYFWLLDSTYQIEPKIRDYPYEIIYPKLDLSKIKFLKKKQIIKTELY
jgi:hypothetical protein